MPYPAFCRGAATVSHTLPARRPSDSAALRGPNIAPRRAPPHAQPRRAGLCRRPGCERATAHACGAAMQQRRRGGRRAFLPSRPSRLLASSTRSSTSARPRAPLGRRDGLMDFWAFRREPFAGTAPSPLASQTAKGNQRHLCAIRFYVLCGEAGVLTTVVATLRVAFYRRISFSAFIHYCVEHCHAPERQL